METYEHNEVVLMFNEIKAPDSQYGFAFYSVEFLTVNEQGLPRNIGSWESNPKIRGYADMVIRLHVGSNKPDNLSAEIEYREVHNMKLRDIELKFKTLSGLIRKMEKVADKLGRPSDDAEFMVHVCQAAGIERCVYRVIEDRHWNGGYDNSEWRMCTPAEFRRKIENAQFQWHRLHDKQNEAA